MTQTELTYLLNEYYQTLRHDTEMAYNPNGVAGGKADAITGLGNSRVNSSIGSQWGSFYRKSNKTSLWNST